MSLWVQPQTVQGRPGPGRALVIYSHFRWNGKPAFFLGLHARLLFASRVLAEPVSAQFTSFSHTALLQTRDEFDGQLVAPLSPEALRYIEDHRGNTDLDLPLEVEYRWQEAISTETQPHAFAGPAHWDQVNASVRIARSDWLQRLHDMEWSEDQLFEIPVLPPAQYPDLSEALRLLDEAQTALRTHDFKGVLAKCREALESAAKHAAQSNAPNVTPAGIELLLSQAFPREQTKVNTLNATIRELSKYIHPVGRHAQYPPIQPSYGEAQFIYVTTVSFFVMVSRRLAGVETV